MFQKKFEKDWGLSAKLGKHSATVPSFPQIPLLEKSTLKG